MSDLPVVSSGECWSEEEDERLYREFESLVAKFEGRSFAAVMSRVAHLNGVWWVRRRDIHKEGRVGRRETYRSDPDDPGEIRNGSNVVMP